MCRIQIYTHWAWLALKEGGAYPTCHARDLTYTVQQGCDDMFSHFQKERVQSTCNLKIGKVYTT